MKLAETLALISAGYTKAEIAAMEAGEDLVTPPEEPAGETVPAPAPVQPVQPAQPAQDNEELLAAIKALTTTLQKSNIRASSQPAGAAVDPVEETRQKATDMLLNLCNT